MRVWGSILNPARDIGVFRPAYSTVSLVKTFRSGPFSQEMHVHCRAPHDPLPAQHQLLVPQEALRREYGAQFWTQRVILGSEYPLYVCVCEVSELRLGSFWADIDLFVMYCCVWVLQLARH